MAQDPPATWARRRADHDQIGALKTGDLGDRSELDAVTGSRARDVDVALRSR